MQKILFFLQILCIVSSEYFQDFNPICGRRFGKHKKGLINLPVTAISSQKGKLLCKKDSFLLLFKLAPGAVCENHDFCKSNFDLFCCTSKYFFRHICSQI